MLLAQLLRAFLPLVVAGVTLMAICILTLNLFEDGFLKDRRWVRRALEASLFGYPLLCVALFAWAARHDRRVEADLKASAAAATPTAVVLEVRDRGIEVGVDPVLTARVRVTPGDAEPSETDVALLASRVDIRRVRPGTTLGVRYDRSGRSRIVVEAVTSVTMP